MNPYFWDEKNNLHRSFIETSEWSSQQNSYFWRNGGGLTLSSGLPCMSLYPVQILFIPVCFSCK